MGKVLCTDGASKAGIFLRHFRLPQHLYLWPVRQSWFTFFTCCSEQQPELPALNAAAGNYFFAPHTSSTERGQGPAGCATPGRGSGRRSLPSCVEPCQWARTLPEGCCFKPCTAPAGAAAWKRLCSGSSRACCSSVRTTPQTCTALQGRCAAPRPGQHRSRRARARLATQPLAQRPGPDG